MTWRAGTQDGPSGGWRASTEDATAWAGQIDVAIVEPGDGPALFVAVRIQADLAVTESGDTVTIFSFSSAQSGLAIIEPGDTADIQAAVIRIFALAISEPGDDYFIAAEVVPIPPSPFDEWNIDVQGSICGRTPPRLRHSPVIRSIQTVIGNRIDEVYRALRPVFDIRTLAGGAGYWLDVLGRIVGEWPRPTLDAANITYFTPDVDLGTVDIAPVFVIHAPIADKRPADDGAFLAAIRARIFRNHIRYGSVPEIKQWIMIAYGIDSSVRRLGLSSVRIIVPDTVPDWIITQLSESYTTDEADLQYRVPLNGGTVLESVVRISEDV